MQSVANANVIAKCYCDGYSHGYGYSNNNSYGYTDGDGNCLGHANRHS